MGAGTISCGSRRSISAVKLHYQFIGSGHDRGVDFRFNYSQEAKPNIAKHYLKGLTNFLSLNGTKFRHTQDIGTQESYEAIILVLTGGAVNTEITAATARPANVNHIP